MDRRRWSRAPSQPSIKLSTSSPWRTVLDHPWIPAPDYPTRGQALRGDDSFSAMGTGIFSRDELLERFPIERTEVSFRTK
jgi:hypothetical protein